MFVNSGLLFYAITMGTSTQSGAGVKLEKPFPPQTGHITHHTVELDWRESFDVANDAIGPQSGDSRIQVIVQQLSPGYEERWIQVYRGYASNTVVTNLSSFSQYMFRIKLLWKDLVESEWSRNSLCTTARAPLNGADLHKAVARKDLAGVVRVLNSGTVYPDATNRYDFTPLMEATRMEYTRVMSKLAENGADINFQNSIGKTALMLAAYSGKIGTVRELRRLGASYELHDKSGSTALHWACISKSPELVDWMAEDGADVSVTNNLGRTPLILLASVEDRYDVANVLIRHGAKVNAQDNMGQTALMIAVYNGFIGLVDFLLQKSADINITNSAGKTIKEVALASDKKLLVECFQIHIDKLEKEQR